MAQRYECALRDHAGTPWNHTSGEGRPKRKACAYCKGTLITHTGEWGVFVHSSVSGDSRYRRESAVSLHSSERKAEAIVSADTTGTLVVRWVSA